MSNKKRKKRLAKLAEKRVTNAKNGVIPSMAWRPGDIRFIGVKHFSPTETRKIKVDPSYQRGPKAVAIKQMADHLKAGYIIPGLIDCAVRDGNDYFAFDGQQRLLAHRTCNKGVSAALWEITARRGEEKAFITWNNGIRVTPPEKIHGWAGPSGILLESLMTDTSSAGRGILNTGPNSRIAISVFATALYGALTGEVAPNKIERTLAVLDKCIRKDKERVYEVARSLTTVAAGSFPKGKHCYRNAARAMGLVAFERWDGNGTKVPGRRALYNISRLNWKRLSPDQNNVYIPKVVGAIKKHWR